MIQREFGDTFCVKNRIM